MARREPTVSLPTLDQVIPPANRRALLQHLALLAVGRIKRRTGQGVDTDGKRFAPYSPRYAKQRRDSGRKASPPTLLLSGAMLGGMNVVRSDEKEAVIGFQGTGARLAFGKRARATWSTKLVAGVKRKRKITHTFRETNRQVSNALKARWNDHGDGNLPRRHFFGLSRADRYELSRLALKELTKMAGRVAFKRALNKR